MAKAPKNAELTELGHREDGQVEEVVNEVNLEKNRDVVDERIARRSEANEEGHAKNMEAAEKLHEGNEGKSDPSLGREDNGNTPVIDKHGNKSWHAPGVAGAAR